MLGTREALTSYDHPAVGSGNVVNDVQFAYNDFSQLTTDYQAHVGAVNTSTTPKVQYGYANGSANTIRPTTLSYPDGRVLTYDYGTADGIDDCTSRVASLVDDDGSSTHLAEYSFLGAYTFAIVDYTEPDTKWTLVDLSGTNDPDTGDIYSGFDRFGRVKDNRWYDYGTSSDVDRIKYGYDRASNRIWRQNVVADALSEPFDELYGYDGVHRLKEMARGILNTHKDEITSKSLAECWSLDTTGNRRKYLEDTNGDGTWNLNQARTANEVNEITNITKSVGASWTTPAYNPAGNMSTIPQPNDLANSYTATHDAWNRLVKLEDGTNTVAEYAYDGAKRRTVVKLYVSGSLNETRHYYFTDPAKWQVIEERVDSSSDADQQFVWGLRYIDDLVLRDKDTTGNGTLDERLYSMQDANWNVTALSNISGGIQQRIAYQPYGESLELDADFTSYSGSDLEWTVRFTGRELDLTIGLQVNRNRYLHLQLGRWITRDPLGYADGMSLYFAHSMLSDTDPGGQRKVCCKYSYNASTSSKSQYWVRERECCSNQTPDECCSESGGTIYTWYLHGSINGPCDRGETPGSGCLKAAGGCLIFACPTPDPFPEEVVRTPAGLIGAGICLAGAAGVYMCSDGGLEYPDCIDTIRLGGNTIRKSGKCSFYLAWCLWGSVHGAKGWKAGSDCWGCFKECQTFGMWSFGKCPLGHHGPRWRGEGDSVWPNPF